MSYYQPVSLYHVGLRHKCPRCGQGNLYKTYLKLESHCVACDLDYSKADSADGPAIFLMFIVGFIAISTLFILRFVFDVPSGIALLSSLLSAFGWVFILLRPMKSILIALQYKHKAAEASLSKRDVFGGEL